MTRGNTPHHNRTLGSNIQISAWWRVGDSWLFAGESGVDLRRPHLALPFRILLGVLLRLRRSSHLRAVKCNRLLCKLYGKAWAWSRLYLVYHYRFSYQFEAFYLTSVIAYSR